MTVKNGCDKVEYPSNCASSNNPNNTDENGDNVLLCYALDNTVNRPNDVKEGKAENNFCKLWKLVNGFDEVF